MPEQQPSSTQVGIASPQLITKLVQLFKQVETNPFHEFEVKLGKLNADGNFTSGISDHQFGRLFEWLSTSTCWRHVQHHEYVDYEFKNNIRGSGGLFQEEIGFIGKHLNTHLDVSATSESGDTGCRFSLKTEIPCKLEIGRDIGTYHSVRVKQRSSFLYKCWSFDLTRIWTGADTWSALSTQPPTNPLCPSTPLVRDRQPDQFEMEIEYLPKWWVDNPYNVENIQFHTYLANAFVGKTIDALVGGGFVHVESLRLNILKEIQIKLHSE